MFLNLEDLEMDYGEVRVSASTPVHLYNVFS